MRVQLPRAMRCQCFSARPSRFARCALCCERALQVRAQRPMPTQRSGHCKRSAQASNFLRDFDSSEHFVSFRFVSLVVGAQHSTEAQGATSVLAKHSMRRMFSPLLVQLASATRSARNVRSQNQAQTAKQTQSALRQGERNVNLTPRQAQHYVALRCFAVCSRQFACARGTPLSVRK